MPGVSTRERSAQHEVDPTCSGCHQMLDPIGFGFENFDTLGRYRSEDGGKAVDASGNVVATRDIDGPFNGVAELGKKLAASSEVKECVTRQWFRYAINPFRAAGRRLLHEERARKLRRRGAKLEFVATSHRSDRRVPLPPPARLSGAGEAMSHSEPKDMRTAISRRKLLGGLSALTVAVTSPIWKAATVFGQDANTKAAKRFIGLFSANGTVAKSFFQQGQTSSETPLALMPILAALEAHKPS